MRDSLALPLPISGVICSVLGTRKSHWFTAVIILASSDRIMLVYFIHIIFFFFKLPSFRPYNHLVTVAFAEFFDLVITPFLLSFLQ